VKPSARTWMLLAAALLLLALNLLDRGGPDGTAVELPEIAAAPAAEVTRIELSDAIRKIVLEPGPDGGGWRLTAPVEAPADAQMVDALLDAFDAPIPVDVRVDAGNLDTYGLDAGNGVIVELWTGGDLPSTSLTVGNPAPGGSSFVRLSGDDAIYRARVGTRDRYPTKAGQWRNRVPLGFARTDVVEVEGRVGDGATWTLRRGDSPGLGDDGLPVPGRWQLDPDPGWSADHDAIDAALVRAGRARADEVLDDDLDGGFDPPAARFRFTLADGRSTALVVGSRMLRDAVLARVEGEEGVFRLPRRDLAGLLRQTADWRDKSLLRFDVADVDTISLEEGRRSSIVRQVGGSGRWQVVEPANVDLDVGELARAAATLATLRGDEVLDDLTPGAAGLSDPPLRLTVYLLDGQSQVLEIGRLVKGPDDAEARLVRSPGRSQIMRLRETTIQRLLQAFGRS